ncbi:MAG: ABC transporter substrate-binding protein [Acidobacteria bacterium]|nr:ABC transporter substrate-binding protein [Acidobacteriota bacterium]
METRARVAAGVFALLSLSAGTAGASVLDLALHGRWETFTKADGLPADEVFAIRIDGERVWAGTREGLALYERGRWTRFGTADGLPNAVVLAVDVSPRTGDVWIATMGGLARWSGGRIDAFTQLNSGLSNDFVHSVRCDPEEDVIWAATAMGLSRFDLRTREWINFDQTNTPMHEPWIYAVGIGDGKVFVGAWGGGVLEYTKATRTWREYRDPDGSFEIDLFPDDGPVNDVTSGVDYGDGVLWQSAYTGLARYDGRRWRSYFQEDSGLAGNFVNFVRSQGAFAWLATDQGLSLTDGDDFVTYRRLDDGRGEITLFRGGKAAGRRTTPTAIAHNDVLGVDARDDEVWVATGRGVSHGVRSEPSPAHAAAGEAAARGARLAGAPAERFAYAATPPSLQPYAGMLPYKDMFTERPAYRGAGREEPPPADLTEIRIGFIGPLDVEDGPVVPPGFKPAARGGLKTVWGRRMLHAATLAVDEANAQGGYLRLPFRIVPRTDLVLWGQTSNELVRFAFEDRVWAVLSGIDSNHNHVLSRASLKVEIPVLSAGSTDPTLVEHSIPWLARCLPDDRQLGYALLHEIFVVRGLRRAAVLRASDRDGRTGVLEFNEGAKRLGHPIVLEQRFDSGETDFRDRIAKIAGIEPDAIVLWGNPEETGRAVRQIREAGLTVPLFGFDRMTEEPFLKLAGAAAEGIVLAATMNPDSVEPRWTSFRDRYHARFGEEPDAFAAHAYDGMNLLIGAIRKAGLNRALIRDALFDLEEYDGVAGKILFDSVMTDGARPWLAVVEKGSLRYRQAAGWPAPAPHAPAGGRRP